MSANVGRGLLFLALAFALVSFFPETRISREPLNDLVLHRAAAERLGASLANGEPFLDPWVSEWSLGYPLWRSYQPLPHLVAAGWLAVTSAFTDVATSFAWLHYLLVCALPVSVFAGARGLGLSPLAAGISSILVLAPSATGELDRYGLGLGAVAWRGSGLFTQVVALHFLVLALGAVRRALDDGRRLWLAALLLAATALSHIVFAYVAVVSSLVVALTSPERDRALPRALWMLGGAALLVAWFYVPLALDLAEANRSRWESSFKWDSFGASAILGDLFRGRLLDAGRAPVLTLLSGAGALAAIRDRRDTLAVRLLTLALLWLALWFGRPTWGALLQFAGIPAAFHLHRLQAAFELFACLLAAFGAERLILGARRFGTLGTAAGGLLLVVTVAAVGVDRAGYLGENAEWGGQSLTAIERERADLEGALAEADRVIAERPGRVVAGKAATWGRDFRVGSVPVYAFLSRDHLDQASFLFHSMSLTSDVMVLRDEMAHAHDVAFGIRAAIAPVDRPMSPGARLRVKSGRFAVYELSSEGYFGLVDVGARLVGRREDEFALNEAWLASEHLRWGVVAALEGGSAELPAIARGAALPPIAPEMRAPRGRIVAEDKIGERYRAEVSLDRPCWALVKITHHPRLVATVDGTPAPLLRVTPGFAAVPVGAGRHEVVVEWRPGPLKPILLVAGLLGFLVVAFAERRALALLRLPALAARPRRAAVDLPLGVDAAALRLFVCFSCLYAAIGPGNFFSVDEVVAERTAEGIVARGTTEVPAMNTTLRGREGSHHAVKGPGLSWLLLPFAAVGRALDDSIGSMSGGALRGPPLGTPEHPLRWSGRFAISIPLLANALVGGACVAALFLLALRFTSDSGAALRLAVAGGVATLLASEATHLFQHPLQALGALLAAVLFSGGGDRPRTAHLLGGIALGITFLSGAEATPVVVVLGGWAAIEAWRRHDAIVSTLLAALGPLAGVVLFLRHNEVRFGTPLSFGYDFARGAQGGALNLDFEPARALWAVAAYLGGPAHSVFLFAPPLVLAALGFREARRRAPRLATALVASAAADLVVVALYGSWHGAVCFGPRLLLAAMLLLLPLAAVAFERRSVAITALVAVGGAIELLGVSVYVTVNEWHRHSAGVDLDGGFAFVPSASPIVVHARSLFAGEHLAPFLLRALASPGPALAFASALAAGVFASALSLYRRPILVASRGDAPPLAVVALLAAGALMIAGAALERPVTTPRDARIFALLEEGLAAQSAGRPVAASEAYAIVLGLEPTNTFALYDLGLLAQDAGRTEEAASLYRRVLAIDPAFEAARHKLSLLGARFP